MDNEKFRAASKAAENWLGVLSLLAQNCAKPQLLDENYRILERLQDSYYAHLDVLREAKEPLAAASDSPVEWGSTARYVWSSAHEAAANVLCLALEWLFWPLADIDDPEQQRKAARKLIEDAVALKMTGEQVAKLQERIRRERAKLLRGATEPHGNGAQPPETKSKMSLDAQALAVFIEHSDWSKVQIAKHLRCNPKSLAPGRCPKLASAIAAYKAKPKMPRGTKDADGNFEAWDDE